jgi:Protein of unknown function (DUF1264)
MGVEYIVSGRLFAGLPPEEKALWHSHVHEVKSDPGADAWQQGKVVQIADPTASHGAHGQASAEAPGAARR